MRYGRDPLDILLRAEARTCKGCINEMKQKVFDSTMTYDSEGRKRRHTRQDVWAVA